MTRMRVRRKKAKETNIRVRELEASAQPREPWRLPWPVLSASAAILTALVGWILITGYCIIGWISIPELRVPDVLAFSTEIWLLAHGISMSMPGIRLSIMPLGLTLLLIAAGIGFCHQGVMHSTEPAEGQVGLRVLQMSGIFTVVYSLILAIARHLVQGADNGPALVSGILMALVIAIVGFVRALTWRPPRFARVISLIGRSLVAGILVMIMTGAAVVALAVFGGRNQVMMIHDSLDPDALGAVMLMLTQLAWLPNFVLWGGSWALGAGVQIGLDSVLSPVATTVGMMPSIPVFGALPSPGAMPSICLLWILSGVLAGIATAWLLVRGVKRGLVGEYRPLGIDVLAIIGAIGGIACGLVFTAMQIPASGNLGQLRLTEIGARMVSLVVLGPCTMGLAGMATGAVLGWIQLRSAESSVQATEDPTIYLGDELPHSSGLDNAEETVRQDLCEENIPTAVVPERPELIIKDRISGAPISQTDEQAR